MDVRSRFEHSRGTAFTVAVHDRQVEITCVNGHEPPGSDRQWMRARRLSHVLHDVLNSGAETVLVDLHDVDDVNTSLLAVLVDAMIHARDNGAHLVMRGSPGLRDLAGICRLEGILFGA